MSDFLQLLQTLVFLVFPFAAMFWMWRRMKRVRADAYRDREVSLSQPAWEERIEEANGLKMARTNNPNDDLIALGAKANQTSAPFIVP
ncbi:hypothetical protein [Sphingomonas sp. HMP6]|uniref:hypothetical protein n=1 Tax=Sphingomonas sp. HMP6 TaxID=1517551 RepID=UPI001596555B|nr:hypothetical protein [Sphingomonas sp. HMP6]